MNMMSVLLGATGLLLVAALILSFGSMNGDVEKAPSQEELAALRDEIRVLRAAEDELRLLREQRAGAGLAPVTPPATAARPDPATPPEPTADEANRAAELAAEKAALEVELAEARKQADDAEQKAEIYKDEAGLALQHKIESADKDQRRARIIKEALLIATVTEWSPEDGFAVLTINRPESAQEGSILAIRRNTGIIGQLKISSVYPDGAAADPIPGTFPGGSLDIQPGDELIIPPL